MSDDIRQWLGEQYLQLNKMAKEETDGVLYDSTSYTREIYR